MPAAQDHKRIGEGDKGPNTGGMGAYAPAPVATAEVMERVVKESLEPTIRGMRQEGQSWFFHERASLNLVLRGLCSSEHALTITGFPFVGMLFTGFMLTQTGPKVLEYNVRFGDPETQALMLLLNDETDLAEVMLVSLLPSSSRYRSTRLMFQACVERRLDSVKLGYRDGYAVSIVLASGGYPGSYPKGVPMTIPPVPAGKLPTSST